ncbi:MAG: putative membrane protein YedE/YeeE [Maribacter sp.]|jgi:uncharacterized membrane protein YedE/YeeE
MDIILQPWPWYIAGPIIALVMFLLLYFGGNFGMSANLRTMCTIAGGARFSDFFKIDWKAQRWNLVFVLGAILGGFISSQFLMNGAVIELSASTIEGLNELGFSAPAENYLPAEIFGKESVFSIKGLLILIGGGFLVGFGTRYAGGCTSGHAISGLSNLQVPSLIAVIGFFIGGLIMTHLLLPIIF